MSNTIKNINDAVNPTTEETPTVVILGEGLPTNELNSNEVSIPHGDDLFQHYNLLPQAIQDLLTTYQNKFDEELRDKYELCEEFLNALKPHGFTFHYGLDGVPYNLHKIGGKTKITLSFEIDSELDDVDFTIYIKNDKDNYVELDYSIQSHIVSI